MMQTNETCFTETWTVPDEGDLKVDTSAELHEEPHGPQVISLITILCFGSHQQVLITVHTTE